MDALFIETRRVLEFLETKSSVERSDSDSPYPFVVRSNPYPVVIGVDVDSEMIDLNHLVQHWTSEGAGELANELLEWLGSRSPDY